MGHWLIGGISYTNLLFQARRIGDCVEHMEADWRIVTKDSEQQVMLKRAKFGRYVSIICAIFVHSGALSYCILVGINYSFIARIEEIMSWVCMTELFRCILAICMVGYFIIMEWSDHDVRNLATYFIVFMSVTFNTFVLCYIGELLTEQVSETPYREDVYQSTPGNPGLIE
ncbi:unnamed protein product [Heterotrigona itama]|uniref:Uncharacterized protein n=1 Tax=Heterotrigona itama TaxID=395501 RepID=A0A6V7H5J2_9HYME|nr:unnamed protein product [Heterotrigona itama]